MQEQRERGRARPGPTSTRAGATLERLERRRLLSAAPTAVNDSFTTAENHPLAVTAGQTSLYFKGNSYIYAGTHTWAATDGTFTADEPYSRTDHNGVEVNFQATGFPSSDYFTLEFAAPAGQVLTAGKTYTGAERFPFESAGKPGLDVYGDGRGSNTVSGQFTVVQAVFNADGSVANFAATFKHFSEGIASQELDGTVYYHYLPAGTKSGVLANDTAAAGKTLTAKLVAKPAHGTVALNANGSFTYTPTANYNGTDSFRYQANDGSANSNVATATVKVTAVNQAPTFAVGPDQKVSATTAKQTVAKWATAISAGPANEASQTVAFAVTADSNPGLFAVAPALSPTGTLTYTPAKGKTGTATVSVQLKDTGGTANGGVNVSAVKSFMITVSPVDHAPVAVADTYATAVNTALVVKPATPVSSLYFTGNSYVYAGTHTWRTTDGTFSAGGSTNEVTLDFDGNGKTSSDNWTLNFAAPAGQTLTPGVTYYGAQRYPFESAGNPGLDVYGDGRGSNTVTGQFSVLQYTRTAAGGVKSFAATFKHFSEGIASEELDGTIDYDVAAPTGVLSNDTDADGTASLTAAVVTGPAHGKLALAADGSFTYTPAAGFTGTDTFTYRANDGQLNSNVATATVHVGKAAAAAAAVTRPVAPTPIGQTTDTAARRDLDVTTTARSTLTVHAPAAVRPAVASATLRRSTVSAHHRRATGVDAAGELSIG